MAPIEKLTALMWAEIHMREAGEACYHVLRLDSDKITPELYHCILTGIVASYCRSFGTNNGLEPIPEFETFDTEHRQQLHGLLKTTRDKMYAHMDFRRKRSQHSAQMPDEELRKITIDVSEDGHDYWNVCREALQPHLLEEIAALCEYQRQRLHEAAKTMATHFSGGKSVPPGSYTLGVDWP